MNRPRHTAAPGTGRYCNSNCAQGGWCDCELGVERGDWITEYPFATAIAAVTAVALTVIISTAYPWGWFQ